MIFAGPALLADPVDVAQTIARDTFQGSLAARHIEVEAKARRAEAHDNGNGTFIIDLNGSHPACIWARAFAAGFAPFTLVKAEFHLSKPDGTDVWLNEREGAHSTPDFGALAKMIAPAAMGVASAVNFRVDVQRPYPGDEWGRIVFDAWRLLNRSVTVQLPAVSSWWKETPWLQDVLLMNLRFSAFSLSGHSRAAMTRELEAAEAGAA